MGYAQRRLTNPGRAAPGPRGYETAAFRRVSAKVRERAERGEPCYFWGQSGYEDCPGSFDWDLPTRDRWGYTTHHLDRLMQGGELCPDPRLMAPAHRRCNSRDGLRARNAIRAGRVPVNQQLDDDAELDRNSRSW